VVFRAVVFKLLVWCEAEGYVSGLQDAAAAFYFHIFFDIQGGSNMTGTDLCVNKPHCAAAVRP